MQTMKAIMLECPDNQLDPSIKEDIKKNWNDEPSALQILRILDSCVASGQGPLAVKALELLLNQAIDEEATTYEALVKRAAWRI